MNKLLKRSHPRGWLRLTTVLLAGNLLAQSILGWPAGAPHNSYAQHSAAAVVQQAMLTLQPASGPVGTTVSVSATGFPREADLSNGATLSFDTTPIPGEQAPIVPCAGGTFGFGPACNATSAALTYTIPPNTAPGTHIFVATAASSAGAFTSNPAPFTVIAPASPTGTATVTATVFIPQPTATGNTPTVTATATTTSTAAPITATATIVASTATATTPPSVPTNTATQTPPAPTASATPSPTVVPKKGIVLIKAAFSAGAVAIVVHTNANAHVTIDFQVLAPDAQGHQHQQYDLKKGGMANSRGVFTLRLAIAYHKPGTAVITVTLSSGSSTRTVRRSYRYGVRG